ncbi:hypothetical protein MUA52_04980 [Staphylococcus agnetis]|uniref:hypothetical protein n=1 Tax=Staphylococcus agnetis TaxID=985762 RepID=UPI0021D30C4A|nr:hypothetical protein [Staphylococcus agnetis]UXU67439.1 hypothetical protein MUA52_04980 [Staphylococcus agnetis]
MVDKVIALIVALTSTFVLVTPIAFEAYFTTTLFVAMWTMIFSYYVSKYVINTLKKTEC